MEEQDPFLPKLAYYVIPVVLGGLASFANLLGSTRALAVRVVVSYILCGALVSLGVVLLMVEYYGQSPFLIGCSVFAGYKALDIMAMTWVVFTRWFNFFVQSKTGLPPEETPSDDKNKE